MTTPLFIAINTTTDAVEAVGTKTQVILDLFKNFTFEEIQTRIKIHELGPELTLKLDLVPPTPEPF